MTSYIYTLLSLRDEQVLEEVPLFGVYAQRILNAPGQFNGTFQLDQAGKSNADLVNATTPGKTWVVMERVESSTGVATPVWWGPIWSRTYQSQSKTVEIFAQGFEVYPQKQLILKDIKITDTIGQMHQFASLWADMQASATGRNINVNVPSSLPTESVLKDVNVLASDYKFYQSPLDELANGIDGFDYTINVTKQYNNVYRKDLLLSYPTLGLNLSDAVAFEYPGQILNYYRTESMADGGTNIFGFGSGEGDTQLVSTFENTDLISSGFPRWDESVSFKDVKDQNRLNELTAQAGTTNRAPRTSFVVTIKGNLDPVFGSYNLGDTITLYINDPMHPGGFQTNTRIVGFELHPQSSDGTEEVKLTLPGDQSR